VARSSGTTDTHGTFHGFLYSNGTYEGQQTIGVATVNGALCLLHTSHTPPEGLLEKTQSVLAQACDERV
jgi:hypothetical protein